MTQKPVTILDISAATGLSKTTVSSALHGSGRVSEATRQRVLETAAAMGYVSNRAAQSLRGGKHRAIGLHLLPSTESLAFYMEFTFGVAKVAAAHGYDLLLLTEGGERRDSRALNVDAILAVDPVVEDDFVAEAVGRGVPVVAVGRYLGSRAAQLMGTVSAEQGILAKVVLDRLRDRGAERPALIAIDNDFAPQWARMIREAYEDWCEERGTAPKVVTLPFTPGEEVLDEALAEFADDVDGLVVVQQGLAARFIMQLKLAGRPVPPIATMAADPSTELGKQELIGVDLKPRDFGARAAEFIFEQLEISPPERQPGQFIVHEAEILG
ncbi:MAG: LacI family DNA-binding transcriptional regulator [Gulosibacter sp.]|uniref:LacI family DNA-binding transcriptional regulator n=1 Tax=Gulosibacter sp. TaxID=2817531 RepID=UPI003F935778